MNLAVRVIIDVYQRYKAEGFTCAVFFYKSRSYDPSDPSNRCYRPENETGELEVYNLVTKVSFDTDLWNILETGKLNSSDNGRVR